MQARCEQLQCGRHGTEREGVWQTQGGKNTQHNSCGSDTSNFRYSSDNRDNGIN